MKVLIVTVMDRSGSMQSIREDMEGGYAAFIAGHAAADPETHGECRVSLYEFSSRQVHGSAWYKAVYERTPVAEVPRYVLSPDGGTALHDAVGKAITDTAAGIRDHHDWRPDKVYIVIVTDGEGNSSLVFSNATLQPLVEAKQEQGWEFLYLGANQDAFKEGSGMGIAAAATMDWAPDQSRHMYKSATGATLRSRGAGGQSVSYTPEERAAAAGEPEEKK